MRIRVYLDRADRLWRVVGVGVGQGVDLAKVAAHVQRMQHRGAGIAYPTWVEAQKAADRMATRNRRQAPRLREAMAQVARSAR